MYLLTSSLVYIVTNKLSYQGLEQPELNAYLFHIKLPGFLKLNRRMVGHPENW